MKFFKTAKKSLGQNFLVDQNIINKIVQIGNIKENKTVLEIGSGYGSLTKASDAVDEGRGSSIHRIPRNLN